jgi:3-hydroxybutyryl-CoA dehydrogenase
LGLLGRGICAALLGHGYGVIGVGLSEEEVQAATRVIGTLLREMAEHGACDLVTVEGLESRFYGATHCESLRDCDFVIESVTEDLATKNNVLEEIERVVARDTSIATNTSAIPINWLQSHRLHPDRVLGMHWAEPAYATRFLELIRGEATSDEAVQKGLALAKRCGKDVCVIEKDIPGFIANRLGYAIIREALHLIELGVADAETIDRSFRNSVGLWAGFCGPLRWIDMTGGPGLYAKAMKPVLPTLSKAEVPPPLLEAADRLAGEESSPRSGFYQSTDEESADWVGRFHRHAWAIYGSAHDDASMETNR